MNENEKDTSRDIDFFITGRDHSKQNSNVPKIESRGRTVPSANVPSANNNVKREQKPSSAERQPVTRKPKPVQPKKSKEYDGLFIEQILNGSKNSNSEENEKTKMIVDGIHVKKDDAGMNTNKIDKVPPSPKKVKKEEENKKTEESSPDYDENFDGDYYEENDSGKLLTSVLKAVIYILGVLVASIVISYTVIVVSNDVFAFVKPSTQIDVVIPESPDLSDIADILKENGVIKYPGIFKFYTKLKDSKAEFVGGTYTVSPSMNYDMLKSTFKLKKGGKTEVSVTVPEGYTIDQIINLLLEKGIGTKEGYIDAIQNYPFNYWFVEQLTELSPDRKYRLEGYLYPDTYYFYSDSDEVTVINKFLSNFYVKFSDEFKEYTKKTGLSVDEIITLASIIQMEAKYESEYEYVSSVFHNRLLNPNFPYLESDATIQYAFEKRKTELSHADTEIDDPYNTYKYKGLPPGPIANPSITAINAALCPADTNYYFFVAGNDGTSIFSKTLNEHNAAIEAIEAEKNQ